MARKQFFIPATVDAEDPEQYAFDVVFAQPPGPNGEFINPVVETFHRLKALPDILSMRLAAVPPSARRTATGAKLMVDFLTKAIRPEERERWEACLESCEDGTIGNEQLGEIVKWLVEEYTGRPTRPSSGSQPTALPTGTTSTPASASTLNGRPTVFSSTTSTP